MTDTLLKIWLYWMPVAFGILGVMQDRKYPHDWSWWAAIVVCSIGWPVYYTLALFHKRRV